MSVRALIFDVDGTLAETEELHRRAFNETFAEATLDWHWDREMYRQLLKTTGGKERMLAFQRQYLPAGPALSPDRVAELHRQKTARYVDLVAGGALTLRPGIAELVARAGTRGIRLAIATTTSRANVDALCKSCWGGDADTLFEVIAAGDEVAKKKPAPDVYLLALQRLDLAADRCVAIEDSRNGVLSALAADLPVHVIPSVYTADERFEPPATEWPSVPTLDQLLDPAQNDAAEPALLSS